MSDRATGRFKKLVQSNMYFSEGRILTCEVNRDKIQWLRYTVEIRRMTEDLRSRQPDMKTRFSQVLRNSKPARDFVSPVGYLVEK